MYEKPSCQNTDLQSVKAGIDSLPFVTIIMPIRNEARYIGRNLGAVLVQDYPSECMEVIVVDGMSADDSREIIQKTAKGQRQTVNDGRQNANHLPSIILLNNPDKIVPTGLNIALRQARGEIVIRVDGHCEITSDYVRRCVELLDETGADCVGGPIATVGETWVARSIALAQSSLFGVGNVAFRTNTQKPGYVDTVAFGAYRREVFDRIGNFDEEFNFRLIQAGGKIWLDPSIRSIYYSRANLRGVWRQYFEYGFYKVRVIQKRGAVPSWRHLVPAIFVSGLLVTILMALFTNQPLWALVIAGPYAAANLIASLWTARRDCKTLPLLPLAFLTLHLSYGIGLLSGLWKWRNKWRRSQELRAKS
jgi:succinoglycan biosynthesis protein ExoA